MLRSMRAKLNQAAAIARATQDCGVNGRPRRALELAVVNDPWRNNAFDAISLKAIARRLPAESTPRAGQEGGNGGVT